MCTCCQRCAMPPNSASVPPYQLIWLVTQLLDALHTLMKFKTYIPINKIVSQSLRSTNFYDQAENVFAAVRVVQVS